MPLSVVHMERELVIDVPDNMEQEFLRIQRDIKKQNEQRNAT